uniref:LYR motif-containing protein 2 n=1 Tax=Fundulus heteroclitus TaxID=8078 RepID=A0A3Q2P9A7_FUNHE
MISRVPPAALSLKQFLQRQRVLALYRNMLRTIRQVPYEADRKYLRDWARDEFKRNKDATNQVLLVDWWARSAHKGLAQQRLATQ